MVGTQATSRVHKRRATRGRADPSANDRGRKSLPNGEGGWRLGDLLRRIDPRSSVCVKARWPPVRIDDDRLIGINWIKVNASVARGTCEHGADMCTC